MAKRFIDTELFTDTWFMDLSIEAKLLWIYCLTNCDHAGVIEWNKKLIKFQVGIDDLETVTKELGKSLVIVNDQKQFIPKYFEFQYPNYPRKRFAQADSALKILVKYNLLSLTNLTLTQDFIKSLGNSNGISKGKKGGAGGRNEKMEVKEDHGQRSPTAEEMPASLKKKFGIKE